MVLKFDNRGKQRDLSDVIISDIFDLKGVSILSSLILYVSLRYFLHNYLFNREKKKHVFLIFYQNNLIRL